MTNKDRLGFYLVGNKKFYNKTLALLESKLLQKPVSWIFNNSVYGSIDWSIPITESLPELYARRVNQLREQYDYIALYYSGGADTNNVLLSFVDNNVFLDEIVMQIPLVDRKNFNNFDRTNRNIYGEIDFCAIPFLQSIKNRLHPATKITIQDYSSPLLTLFQSDNWFESNPIGTMLGPGIVGRQAVAVMDKEIHKLCDGGKRVCQLMGVDKPLVGINESGDYFAYFSDLSAMHCAPVNPTHNEIFHNRYVTEFFYWSPSLPEVVIKQAQEIKKQCELDINKKTLWQQSFNVHIEKFKDVMHPIIYPGRPEPLFQTEKPTSQVFKAHDGWFWDSFPKSITNNYLDVIKYLDAGIEKHQCKNNSIYNGLLAHNTGFYKL
jgi:hypothetical protein